MFWEARNMETDECWHVAHRNSGWCTELFLYMLRHSRFRKPLTEGSVYSLRMWPGATPNSGYLKGPCQYVSMIKRLLIRDQIIRDRPYNGIAKLKNKCSSSSECNSEPWVKSYLRLWCSYITPSWLLESWNNASNCRWTSHDLKEA